ncbi:MAG TPA: UDP-glucose/GDP-mannose dehydrogenase family protein [Pyrinomonadaceae bacterium]|nr:UDP-glucose/GDP-mannose dehydrogenase family protein [Pyrinomonadaceae bacterium]HMP66305.1 UDP-glucose/GDP-mannose dehydrogenase family protein [Pyrinomonadaceae bacterium]
MRISVFGLGYVGAVSAACFADDGHEVVGVDVSETKVSLINEGRPPIIEEGIAEMTRRMVESGHLRATTDAREAVLATDISLVCVGTPSNENGSLRLDYVERVSEEIGAVLAEKPERHIVVMRSTMLPGTIEGIVRPALERTSGKKAVQDFDLSVNPEFLREGTSIKDFYAPPFTLIGADTPEAGDRLKQLYSKVEAPLYVTSVKAAEMVKYACNCFHGLKVAFANEIGNICKESDIDSHEVMDVFVKDTKLNLSPYYLKPGFAFGGSCLPKDLRALAYRARQLDVPVPVLEATLESNLLQIERAVQMIVRTGKKRIGFLGFAFKAGTDDLRESPVVTVIERMIGKGYDVRLYDREVSLARLVGANKQYIEQEIPHIARLMAESIDEVVESSDVIVIGNKADEFKTLETTIGPDRVVIDLVRMFGGRRSDELYQGICW